MLSVQVTMKDIPSSQTLENLIRFKAQKLALYTRKINSCRVVVEVPQKHKRQGKLFSVHIDVTVPGKELASSRKENEDIYIAIRDAFLAIERQLEKYWQKRSGHVKHHESFDNLSSTDASDTAA
jgi:ribosomal subunit interface protein